MKNKLIIILATLSSALQLQAADKVGLVLSGGGAKGIAHVGVIKALEDNDIPIDYVAGTSMGSIVGSLYSCGWSPDSMLNMMTSKDFLNWSSGIVDKKQLNLVSSPRPTPEWAKISFGGEDTNIVNQVLPKSLINPTPMNMEFLKLFSPYTKACGGDFNRLFVPFRCVFSDVYHKHKVICRKGSLGESVRGSMSFPLVYRSIVVDSILAFDGGIYDNFPVDVMRDEFHPDFIIGVSVSHPDGKPKVDNMYSELEDLIIQNNDYSLDPELGVKIQVPVSNYGVLSFADAQAIYDIGYRTGLEWVDSIKCRLNARRPLEEVRDRRERYASTIKPVTFDSISTPGLGQKERNYLLSVFRSRLENGTITMNEVEGAYYNAVSQGDIEELLPEAVGNALILKAKVKHPWRAAAGGWLTTGINSFIYGDIGYHTLKKHALDLSLSLWGGQSYAAIDVFGRIRLDTYNPGYLTLEGMAARKKYYDSLPFFFSAKDIQSFVSNTQFVRAAYEMECGRSGMLRLSLAYGSDFKVHTAKGAIEYEYNTLGARTFPVTGKRIYVSASASHMSTESEVLAYPASSLSDRLWRGKIQALWTNYYQLGKNFTLGAYAQGGVSIGKRFSDRRTDLMTSHFFMPIESMDNCYIESMRGDDFAVIGAIPVWTVFSRFQLRGEGYAYTKYRDSSRWHVPFSKTEFVGRVSIVGTLPFASISVFTSYASALSGWNFGVSIGWYVPAPSL